jgi:hypothetical protein
VSRSQQIGFTQRVKLAWLEQAASLALTGKPEDDVWDELTAYLAGEISTGSSAKRGSREKVRTVLTQVWLDGPRELRAMQKDGLSLLCSLPPKDHLAVHWGMTMAVYPFCGAVAATVGKLAALQGDIPTTQVQRRMQEQFGERETVRVSTRRAFGTLVEWGMVKPGKKKNNYSLAPKRTIASPGLAAWLVEAVLRQAPQELVPLNAAVRAQSLFAFALPAMTPAVLGLCSRLEVVRHGLDEQMLRLVG